MPRCFTVQDGSPIVGVIPCYCGDIAEGERVLKPLRRFGSPVMDTIQPLPFPSMQSLLAQAFPMVIRITGNPLYRELPDDAIAAIVERGNQMKSPLYFVVIEYYGGAAARDCKRRNCVPASEASVGHPVHRTVDRSAGDPDSP